MTTELVAQLRSIGEGGGGYELSHAEFLAVAKAANEIERLRNVCADGLKQLDSNVTEIGRLRAAIYQACSDMGCYCADDDPLPENLKCPMCKLEKALHGSAADVPGTRGCTCDKDDPYECRVAGQDPCFCQCHKL